MALECIKGQGSPAFLLGSGSVQMGSAQPIGTDGEARWFIDWAGIGAVPGGRLFGQVVSHGSQGTLYSNVVELRLRP